MDWEVFVAAVAEQICNEQTPQCLLRIRGALYELLQNCIPADVIIKVQMCGAQQGSELIETPDVDQ